LVTGYHHQFETEGLLKKSGKIIGGGAKARGGALGRLHGIAHIQQGFVRCIRADIKNSIGLFRRADPTVLKPVKLDFFLARELLDVSYPTLLAEEGSVDG
jgi:hypothetical protein